MFIDLFLLHVKAFKPVCANLVSGSYRIGDETNIGEKNRATGYFWLPCPKFFRRRTCF
jgi:hypothetical protein